MRCLDIVSVCITYHSRNRFLILCVEGCSTLEIKVAEVAHAALVSILEMRGKSLSCRLLPQRI